MSKHSKDSENSIVFITMNDFLSKSVYYKLILASVSDEEILASRYEESINLEKWKQMFETEIFRILNYQALNDESKSTHAVKYSTLNMFTDLEFERNKKYDQKHIESKFKIIVPFLFLLCDIQNKQKAPRLTMTRTMHEIRNLDSYSETHLLQLIKHAVTNPDISLKTLSVFNEMLWFCFRNTSKNEWEPILLKYALFIANFIIKKFFNGEFKQNEENVESIEKIHDSIAACRAYIPQDCVKTNYMLLRYSEAIKMLQPIRSKEYQEVTD